MSLPPFPPPPLPPAVPSDSNVPALVHRRSTYHFESTGDRVKFNFATRDSNEANVVLGDTGDTIYIPADVSGEGIFGSKIYGSNVVSDDKVTAAGTGSFRQVNVVQTGSGQYGIINLVPNVGGVTMSQGTQIAAVGGVNSGTRVSNYVNAAGGEYGTKNFFTGATGETYGGLAPSIDIDGNGVLNTRGVRPCNDNDHALGSASKKWMDVYSVNSTLNTSDLRLKTVTGTCPGLDLLSKLKPISFQWKDGKRTHFGFGAQQVHEVLQSQYPMPEGDEHPQKNMCGLYWYAHTPEHTVTDDKGVEHTIPEQDTCGLRTVELVPVLTQSIAELLQKIRGLEDRLYAAEQALRKRKRES